MQNLTVQNFNTATHTWMVVFVLLKQTHVMQTFLSSLQCDVTAYWRRVIPLQEPTKRFSLGTRVHNTFTINGNKKPSIQPQFKSSSSSSPLTALESPPSQLLHHSDCSFNSYLIQTTFFTFFVHDFHVN